MKKENTLQEVQEQIFELQQERQKCDVKLKQLQNQGKATYKQIQNYVLEKFGVKVSTLYIAQVKKKHGLEVREHYLFHHNLSRDFLGISISTDQIQSYDEFINSYVESVDLLSKLDVAYQDILALDENDIQFID
ncbi:hypothetical protein OJ929_01870 [Streptococcus anginosus]|nr:hypothetical protein [Streptococcus anginosus]MCW0996700.1 hypothetical protein [Streptococcus anginosus]